jgi:ammonia channel protein AmtB
MAEREREFQITLAETQSLSDWVNSLLAILGSVVLALGVLFTTPFLSSSLSIDERVLFLPNAGIMAIVGALLFLGLIIFNVGYMRTRWGSLRKQFIGNNVMPKQPEISVTPIVPLIRLRKKLSKRKEKQSRS